MRKDRTLYYRDKTTGKVVSVPESQASEQHESLSKKKEFIGDSPDGYGSKMKPYEDLSKEEINHKVHYVSEKKFKVNPVSRPNNIKFEKNKDGSFRAIRR